MMPVASYFLLWNLLPVRGNGIWWSWDARISRMGTGSAHQRFPAPCFVNATERGVYQCNAMFINASGQARLLRRKMRRLRCVHERKSKVPWQPLPVPWSQWPNRLHLIGPQLCQGTFLVHGVNTNISRKTAMTILEGMWMWWCNLQSSFPIENLRWSKHYELSRFSTLVFPYF